MMYYVMNSFEKTIDLPYDSVEMQEKETSHYRTLYEKITKLSSKIRFVTIINFDGRLMFGGQRDGISNYLDSQSQEKSLQHALRAWRLREQFSNAIGECKYALAEYGKIKRIVIAIDKDHLMYLTTEVSEDHNALIEQILRMKNQ